jgi:inhibitor of nuclear factor kappa-B kinase subunit alpha
MILGYTPLSTHDTRAKRWKDEWQEMYGPVEGIAAASNPYEFRCLLCRRDYNIGKMGIEAVKRHIGQSNHSKKRTVAWDQLKAKILSLLKESAEGLSNEELIRLTAPTEELPLSNGHREYAINELVAEGKAVATRAQLDETFDALVWLEKARPETSPISKETIEQLRFAFVFLVKEKGMSRVDVAKLFGVKCHTVGDAVKRFEETGGFNNRPGQGRKIDTARVEEVKQHLAKNSRTTHKRGIVGNSTRKLGRKIRAPRESVRRIFKKVLGLKPYKDVERKTLTPDQIMQRIVRGKHFRTRFADGRHRQIIFTDESPFVIEQHHNAQNDRTWSATPPDKEKRSVWRDMKPDGLMVFGGVGYNYKSSLFIVPKSMRINTQDYLRIMRLFEKEAKEKIGYTEEGGWARKWTYQQDGAPSHTSNETQRWLLEHFPDVITKRQWPAASPDINPIELIWGILKPRVNAEAHPDVKSLARALDREWGKLTYEEINACIDGWPERLDAMIKANGKRFE